MMFVVLSGPPQFHDPALDQIRPPKVAEMTQSGYQLYSRDMVKRVERIGALQARRFCL